MEFSIQDSLSLAMSALALFLTFRERNRRRLSISLAVGSHITDDHKHYEPTLTITIANTGNTVITIKELKVADSNFESTGFFKADPIKIETGDVRTSNQCIYNGHFDDDIMWDNATCVVALDIHGKKWRKYFSDYELQYIKERKRNFAEMNFNVKLPDLSHIKTMSELMAECLKDCPSPDTSTEINDHTIPHCQNQEG
jgi:hypothetical protein